MDGNGSLDTHERITLVARIRVENHGVVALSMLIGNRFSNYFKLNEDQEVVEAGHRCWVEGAEEWFSKMN